ncbi:MAG TPA: hypothetical protein VFG89_10900 [Coriobacteriia bacterium]|nr:hypothetical protein [Coriobacteriia bacterium]
MVDQAQLKQSYRTTAIICAAIAVAPLIMLTVGFFVARADASGLVGSGRIDVLLLGVFGSLALLPLIVVPVVRNVSAELPVNPADIRPMGARLMMWTILEYAVWEVSSIIGLVAFILGAPGLFFIAAVVVTLQGYIRSFPKWPEWVARAEAAGRS